MEHATAQAPQEAPVEQVDAVLVSEPRPLPVRRASAQVVRTQAAVAAGSFAVGAATAVVVAHRRARKASSRAARRRQRNGVEVAATRSFLVDVHLLSRRP
jgi:hypothetical protein